MIVEFFLDCITYLISGAISLLGVVTLPLDLISALSAIFGYGAYVVGADLLLIVFGTIMFWYGARLAIGIILFVWRLLPFT